jgi:hypothetical protein
MELQRQLRQTLESVPKNPTGNGPAPMLLDENEDMRTRANTGVAVSENDEASRSGDDRTKLDEAASTELATRFEDLSISIVKLKEGTGRIPATQPCQQVLKILSMKFCGRTQNGASTMKASYFTHQLVRKFANCLLENWKIIPRQLFSTEKQEIDNLWDSTCIRWPKTKDQPGFPQFMELPTELRSMIWELVLPEPRVVQMREDKTKDTRFELCYGKVAEDTDIEECPLRFACRDSWRVFTQNYHQLNV